MMKNDIARFALARPDFAAIAAWIPNGATVLDLGCGDGSLLRYLKETREVRGYGVEINGLYDGPTQTVVRAFQRHFRPSRVDGIADSSTVITLHRLLQGQEQA